jgi:hypothetical protein
MEMRKTFLALVSVALVACVSVEQGADIVATSTLPSQSDRAVISDYVRNTYKDPYSIRDAEISNAMIIHGKRWLCLYLNAKNSHGEYTGRKIAGVNIVGGNVVGYWRDHADCEKAASSGLRFHPFPELEKL